MRSLRHRDAAGAVRTVQTSGSAALAIQPGTPETAVCDDEPTEVGEYVPAGTYERAALAPVTARLYREGIEIDAQAAPPGWKGERVDIGWAVGLLWKPRPDAPSAHT